MIERTGDRGEPCGVPMLRMEKEVLGRKVNETCRCDRKESVQSAI